jgi:hypothetical protein
MKTIPLTSGLVTVVDDDDYDELSKYKWCSCSGRAARPRRIKGEPKFLIMSRVIMDAPKGMEVDHRDGNPLNNQRHNLRVCTPAENQHNQKKQSRQTSSQYKGVHWHKASKRWMARIKKDKKKHYLGCFEVEEDAARVYDKAARTLFGKFARLNFYEGD